ncbi:MAG: hypothetical protein ABIJ16_03445 [Bacteroidota bacterium]
MYETEEQAGYAFTQSIYYDIGMIDDDLRVKVIETIDLIENYSSNSIRFEIYVLNDKKEVEQMFYANVPSVEAEQMSFALDTISTKFSKPPKNYTEVIFSSSEGFSTGCFWYAEEKMWLMFIKTGDDENAQKLFNANEFNNFIKLYKKAEKIFK